MSNDFEQSLREHLVHLVQETPARERRARRRLVGAALTAAVALGAGATGWALGHDSAPDAQGRTAGDEGTFIVHQEHIGTSEVAMPAYPGALLVQATFTCVDAGTLTLAGWDVRECDPGQDLLFTVELSDQAGGIPVQASDESMRWIFHMEYTLEQAPEHGDDDPNVLPDGGTP